MKRALIIGAGPAGLTAAFEMLERSEYQPLVLEASGTMGGIARTVDYRGNRIDVGGHRFFSKSQRVMDWWLARMPLEGPDTEGRERVMLRRSRQSRIYFDRRFFDYPIRLSVRTLARLGPLRSAKIALSYLRALALPHRDPRNLEEFLVDRFGRELYRTFFESYTEKVWGVPCREISAEWGAQRIKGLSVRTALAHLLRSLRPGAERDLAQKDVETSLIESFLYPKYGPGQMWETVAGEIEARGGLIRTFARVDRVEREGTRIRAIEFGDTRHGVRERLEGDVVVSTMPVPQLVEALTGPVPDEVRDVARRLRFRAFLTVGLLYRRLALAGEGSPPLGLPADNWIYVQEPDVRLGRLQIFNNWSPSMVADPDTAWLGLEYFCDEGDALWSMSDEGLRALGVAELDRLGIARPDDCLDGTVIRMPRCYPAYFGSYDRIGVVREHLDAIDNLFLVGRNGMHRYNNQDHSMLAAMELVDMLAADRGVDKARIWAVNTEEEYHERARA